MPPPSVWGPPLWKVLHGIEATVKIASLQKDSEREGLWLLTHAEYIIPCKECIEHLVQFRKKNPILKSYSTIGEWICALHNSVNEKLGKEVLPYSVCTTISVKEDWSVYIDCIKDSIQLGLVVGDKLREFNRHMLLWMQYTY
jgi:hypothetical protein